MLKWAEQQAIIALPTDFRKQRVADNAQIFDFQLEYNDISAINKLDRQESFGGNYPSVETIKWSKKNDNDFQRRLNKEHREMMAAHAETYRAHKEAQRNKDEL